MMGGRCKISSSPFQYDVPVTITGPGEFYLTINRTGSWGEFSLRVVVTENAPTYTVTWNNWDGTELEKDGNVEEGTTPTYNGATPEKEEDDENTYEFAGWTDGTNTYGLDDELPEVTADVTYTDTFTATPKTDPDQAAADGVTYLINQIPETVTENDREAIENARKAYEMLTDDQKALVDAETLAKLEAAEEAMGYL